MQTCFFDLMLFFHHEDHEEHGGKQETKHLMSHCAFITIIRNSNPYFVPFVLFVVNHHEHGAELLHTMKDVTG